MRLRGLAALCGLSCLTLAAAADADAADDGDSFAYRAVVAALHINGIDEGTVLMLRRKDGAMFASDQELRDWGLCRSSSVTLVGTFDGQSYYPLPAETKVRYDETDQTIDMLVPASCFHGTSVSVAPGEHLLTTPAYGGFLNYDIYAAGSRGQGQRSDNASAFVEAGAFSPFGSLTSTALAPRLVSSHENASDKDSTPDLVRLDSTWSLDDPGTMTRWEAGDVVGGSGIWGRPVRLGGIRVSRNFESRPGFVSQPLAHVEGLAELPSTVEVYLNGMLETRQEVDPGAFRIADIPSFGSGGQVRVVVRDLLGRETVTELPFVTGATLLRAGLSDFSVEGGVMRQRYGTRSFDYGDGVFSATGRYGFTDRLTGEARVEGQQGRYAAGLGGSAVVPGIHYIVTGAAAYSNDTQDGGGHQETIGFVPGSARYFGLSGSAQFNSAHFAQTGTPRGYRPPYYTAALSFSLPRLGFLSSALSQVRSKVRQGNDSVVNSVSLGASFGRAGSLSLSAFQARNPQRNTGALLLWSMSLGGNDSFISTVNTQKSEDSPRSSQFQGQLTHVPDSELGLGWNVHGGHRSGGGGETVGAGALYQAPAFTLSGQLDEGTYASNYQTSLSGGFGIVGGEPFASRRIFDSFGVARLPGVAGVGVYVNNQLAGYTDEDGDVLLPRLISFTDNKISVDANTLPFDVELDGGDAIEVTPYRRTGVVVGLPVRRVRSALVTLRLVDGTPPPAGSQVTLAGSDLDSIVATQGEVYFTDVQPKGNVITVQWGEDGSRHCEARFDLPENAGVQPRIGPLECREAP